MNPDLRIFISVDEVFDNDHRVVSQQGRSEGRFTFSAADSGDHKICFMPSQVAQGGWLGSGAPTGGLKLTLDLALGETSAIESADKGKIQDIVQKVKDLNARLQDIRREQVFQRVCSMSRCFDHWVRVLTYASLCRSEKRNSEISLKRPILGLCGGCLYNLLF